MLWLLRFDDTFVSVAISSITEFGVSGSCQNGGGRDKFSESLMGALSCTMGNYMLAVFLEVALSSLGAHVWDTPVQLTACGVTVCRGKAASAADTG